MTCKKGHECSRITAWRHFWGHHATGLLFSCHSLTSSYDTASFCHLMLLGTVFLISHKGLCEELWGNIFLIPRPKNRRIISHKLLALFYILWVMWVAELSTLPFLTRGAMKPNPRAVLRPASSQTVAELPRAQETRTSPWDVASVDPHGLPTDSGVRSRPKFKMGDAVNSPDCIIVHSFFTSVYYCLVLF